MKFEISLVLIPFESGYLFKVNFDGTGIVAALISAS